MTAADLRLVTLAGVVWLATLLGFLTPAWVGLGVVLTLGLGLLIWLLKKRRIQPHYAAWVAALAVGALGAGVRVHSVQQGPVAQLAHQGAVVRSTLLLTSDPIVRQGRFGDYVMARATVLEVAGRGSRWTTQVPVLLMGAPRAAAFGDQVRVLARASPSDDVATAAVLSSRGPPQVLKSPGVWSWANPVRASLRASVAHLPVPQRSLVPALVDGDDAGLPATTVGQFRVAGLTHLLAVSGTNLTLLLGFLLLLARVAGVRARGLVAVGVVGVVGFVAIARPEPSVLRAAAMGSVALIGMSSGKAQGLRALGAAALVLLLIDPWLALSWGFAMSVSATAGILIWGPGWRSALATWMPATLAEAIAVPLAAQVATTPLVAALSGQISLAAVAANVAVGPVIGPATVLGMLAGLVGLVWQPGGQALGTLAGFPVWWLVQVAKVVSGLPTPALSWTAHPAALALLVVACLGGAALLGGVLRHRRTAIGLGCLSLVITLVHWAPPGWPSQGWVLAACDVGQGDGLVLNAGNGFGVVVDAGPEPSLIDWCLRRLRIRQVPLVVLTHFHRDHVGGLAGVLPGRGVRRIEVTDLAAPADMVDEVHGLAAPRGIPVSVGVRGEVGRVGALRWELIAPVGRALESDSPPNDASLVLLVQVRGVRLLLMGDQEVPSQSRLHEALPALRADVLKVAHHGSAKQDIDLISGLGARLALITVGAHNDYGHPAPSTTRMLRRLGMMVRRTDRDGDIVVIVDDRGQLRVRTSK